MLWKEIQQKLKNECEKHNLNLVEKQISQLNLSRSV